MKNIPNLNSIGLGYRTASTSSTAVIFEIIAPLKKSFYIDSITLYAADTAANIVSLGFPAARGITPTTPRAFQLVNGYSNPTLVPTITAARAWGTPPVAPAISIAQAQIGAVIGNSVKFTFDLGLFVPASTTFVIYSNATTGILDVTVLGREG
jgi:hypothetical protein